MRGYVHHLKVPLIVHGDLMDSISCRLLSQSAIIFFVESGIFQGHVWKGLDNKNPQCQSPDPPQTVLVAEDLATTEWFCSGCSSTGAESEWQLVTGKQMFAEMHALCVHLFGYLCVYLLALLTCWECSSRSWKVVSLQLQSVGSYPHSRPF